MDTAVGCLFLTFAPQAKHLHVVTHAVLDFLRVVGSLACCCAFRAASPCFRLTRLVNAVYLSAVSHLSSPPSNLISSLPHCSAPPLCFLGWFLCRLSGLVACLLLLLLGFFLGSTVSLAAELFCQAPSNVGLHLSRGKRVRSPPLRDRLCAPVSRSVVTAFSCSFLAPGARVTRCCAVPGGRLCQ